MSAYFLRREPRNFYSCDYMALYNVNVFKCFVKCFYFVKKYFFILKPLKNTKGHFVCYSKKTDKPMSFISLSALRLCVWLSDYFYFHIFNFNQNLIFTFRTIKRIIFQQGILSYLIPCFTSAYRTFNPFRLTNTKVGRKL